MSNYIWVSLTIFAIELIYFRIADHFNIIDKPNMRSSHTHITLRGGGVIFTIGMWLYAAFFGVEYIWFLIGLTAISAVSFTDDVHSVPNWVRLTVQFAAMLLMFYQWGILATDSWWQIIIALIFCTGIINAFNFMDGINGITGSYSLAVLVPLIVVNHYAPFIEDSLLWVAVLSVLVFCFFNFRTKAKCFAGDVGAVGIAFILIFALGKLVIQTGSLWYIVFMAVYGVDVVLTILHRIMLKEKLGEAHRKHAYQIMANELHIPHVVVSSIYLVLQLLVSAGAIWLPINKWLYLAVVLIVLSTAYVLFMKKKYHLHREYLEAQNAITK
ncbi:MAG: glycosyltransferase family 4 protein [Tidjanibacter sp.]|nr:glycosyltransferase family 4 protein [Tidjanibacter sp.]